MFMRGEALGQVLCEQVGAQRRLILAQRGLPGAQGR